MYNLNEDELIVMKRSHFDIIQQNATLFGNLTLLGSQFFIIDFGFYLKNPFLFSFLTPHHSDDGTDADDAKQ